MPVRRFDSAIILSLDRELVTAIMFVFMDQWLAKNMFGSHRKTEIMGTMRVKREKARINAGLK